MERNKNEIMFIRETIIGNFIKACDSGGRGVLGGKMGKLMKLKL